MITEKEINIELENVMWAYYEEDPSTAQFACRRGIEWAIGQLKPEIDALKAENERLLEAVEIALKGLESGYRIAPINVLRGLIVNK